MVYRKEERKSLDQVVFIVFVVVEKVAARRIIILFSSNFVSTCSVETKEHRVNLPSSFCYYYYYYLCFIIHHLEL